MRFKSKTIQNILRILITILFVYFVNRNLTKGDLRMLLAHCTFLPVMIVVALGIAGFLVQVARWKLILEFQEFSTKGFSALKTMLWGSLLAFVTPGRLGELFRGFGLDPTRKGDSVIAVVLDRGFAIATTLLFGMVFLSIQKFAVNNQVSLLYGILNASLIILVILCYILIRHAPKLLDKYKKISHYLHLVQSRVPRLLSKSGVRIVLYSLLTHVLLILQTALLLFMFGAHDVWRNCIIAAQSYAFMVYFPIFIANAGVREYSFRLFLDRVYHGTMVQFDISAVALGVSMLVLFTNIILPALVGLVWAILDKTQLKAVAPAYKVK